MRKLNEQVAKTSSAPTPSATPTPRGSPAKPSVSLPESSSNIVTIDPGAKARAATNGSGGQVEPTLDSDGNVISTQSEKSRIKVQAGEPPWITIITEIIPYLSDPAWQARHGASQGIMEIIRSLPSLTDTILLPISRHFLTLLALDRFGDFLGDTVVAPVRETSAQGLGICLRGLSVEGVKEVHGVLVQMIRQTWAKRGKEAAGREKWERFSWEIRHAGLLGLKYEVAVRGDLLHGRMKAEEDGKMEVGQEEGWLMTDVVDVAILS
jgi:TATA-binding protein-associated factor